MIVTGMFSLAALLIMLGNILLSFQLAMSGQGRPNRWYMLFFASYELSLPYLQGYFLARLSLLGVFIVMILTAQFVLAHAGSGARMAFTIGTIILCSGFFVPAWRQRRRHRP